MLLENVRAITVPFFYLKRSHLDTSFLVAIIKIERTDKRELCNKYFPIVTVRGKITKNGRVCETWFYFTGEDNTKNI